MRADATIRVLKRSGVILSGCFCVAVAFCSVPAEEPAAAAGAAHGSDRRIRSIRSLLPSASSCSLVLLRVVMHDTTGVGWLRLAAKLSRAAPRRAVVAGRRRQVRAVHRTTLRLSRRVRASLPILARRYGAGLATALHTARPWATRRRLRFRPSASSSSPPCPRAHSRPPSSRSLHWVQSTTQGHLLQRSPLQLWHPSIQPRWGCSPSKLRSVPTVFPHPGLPKYRYLQCSRPCPGDPGQVTQDR